jgi:hypothetical protein
MYNSSPNRTRTQTQPRTRTQTQTSTTTTTNNDRQYGNTSRKQGDNRNLNHLLNFQMPARNGGYGSGGYGSGGHGGMPRRSRGVKFQNGAYLRESEFWCVVGWIGRSGPGAKRI